VYARVKQSQRVVKESSGKERRVKWFDHVMRREKEYVGREVLEMEVQGRRK